MPDGAKHVSKEYEKCLADMIIMIAPFAPSFAEELWAGLSSVARSKDYQWVSLIRTLQYLRKKSYFVQKRALIFEPWVSKFVVVGRYYIFHWKNMQRRGITIFYLNKNCYWVILLFNMEIRLINVEAVDVMLQWLRNNTSILLVVMEITGNILCLGCV